MVETIETPEINNRLQEPLELIDGLFYLINGEAQHKTEASGYAIQTPEYLITIDRGSGKYASIVDKQLLNLAQGKKIIDIGTHRHLDHIGGVSGELWLPESYITTIPTGDMTASDLYNKKPLLSRPTRILGNGEELNFGSVSISTISTPGHSPDHAVYHVKAIDGTSFMIMGDLLGGYSEKIGSDLTEQVRSVKKVTDLSFTHFVEGHGSITQPLRKREEFDQNIRQFGEQLHPGFSYLLNPMK